MAVLVSIVLVEALFTPFAPPDPAKLLSGVAKLVLESRLRELQSVDVQIQASPVAILGGGVDGVRVRGRGWCTPMRLSCRTLDVSVGRTAIDVPALVKERRIVLQRAAEGDATMTFSGADWRNFVQHPLFSDAIAERRSIVACPDISFANARAAVQPDGMEFSLKWGKNAVLVRLYQQRDGQVAAVVRADDVIVDTITAAPALDRQLDEETSRQAAAWIVSFFETLVLDLDGCELRYRSLRIENEKLELRLGVCVRSFPSLDINF